MKDRNIAILVTAMSAIVCGCLGLFISITGVIAALGAPEYDRSFIMGGLLVCLGFAIILVPIGVGFYTLGPVSRKKPQLNEDNDAPIPPAI